MYRRPLLDLRELVGPAMIALLFLGVVVTFAVAFILTDDGGEELVAEVTPTPVGQTPGPPPPGGQVPIAMIPTIKFDTDTLTIAADTPVDIFADNVDTGILHNFAVYADDSAQELLGGTEICPAPCQDTLTLELPPGIYFFRCDVHPRQMVGTLVVEG